MKFNDTKGLREHIMEMRDIVVQLKSLEIEMSESFLVHFILNSLPFEYEPFKISYNTHKEKWSVNELLTMCVQEKGRLNQESIESAHLVTQEKKPNKKGNLISLVCYKSNMVHISYNTWCIDFGIAIHVANTI